eukprot:365294-Chlamydomonas_euryale.AAC.11
MGKVVNVCVCRDQLAVPFGLFCIVWLAGRHELALRFRPCWKVHERMGGAMLGESRLRDDYFGNSAHGPQTRNNNGSFPCKCALPRHSFPY